MAAAATPAPTTMPLTPLGRYSLNPANVSFLDWGEPGHETGNVILHPPQGEAKSLRFGSPEAAAAVRAQLDGTPPPAPAADASGVQTVDGGKLAGATA
jgi:hypothetical protein